MKINLVTVDQDLMAVGFRKVASYTRKLYRDVGIYYISLSSSRSIHTILMSKYGEACSGWNKHIHDIAAPIADADIIAFSSMTPFADLTLRLLNEVKKVNSKSYVIWGGDSPYY